MQFEDLANTVNSNLNNWRNSWVFMVCGI